MQPVENEILNISILISFRKPTDDTYSDGLTS